MFKAVARFAVDGMACVAGIIACECGYLRDFDIVFYLNGFIRDEVRTRDGDIFVEFDDSPVVLRPVIGVQTAPNVSDRNAYFPPRLKERRKEACLRFERDALVIEESMPRRNYDIFRG